jgi:tetratricopeptide (TPR) repeat protein
VLSSAASGQAAAGDSTSSASQPAPDEHRVAADELNATVTTALERFRARDFAAAAQQFDLAIALAPAGTDLGTLHFNAAASLYELGRFAEAEQRFAKTAALAPALASLSLLNAGMAALADGRVEVAIGYANAAPSGDEEAESRRSELEALIAQAEATREKQAFYQAMKQGIDAYADGDLEHAREWLARSVTLQASAPPADRAIVQLTLADIALERHDLATARRSIDAAIGEDPTNAEAYAARAELSLTEANGGAAEADAQRSLALAATGGAAQRARRVLDRLDVLPPAGPSFVATLGAGYDSNASQSGAAELAGGGETSASQASPLLSAGVQLDFTARPSRSTAIVPYYLGDFYTPTVATLQPLALQAHELGGQIHWRMTPELRLRFTAGSSLVLSGLKPMQPFTWEGVFGARADLATGEHATTSVDLTLRPARGLGDRDYLSGTGLDGTVEERLTSGRLRVSIGGAYRYLQRGTQTIAIDDGSSFTECHGAPPRSAGADPPLEPKAPCNNLAYALPLSYQGPSGRLAAAFDLLDQLSLGASAKVEYRRYLEPSFVRSLPTSRKTREDVRYRLRAYGELALDSDEHVSLLLSYEALISRSNIAFDANDPQHRYDYGDRNFVEHLVELGLELRL